MSPLQACMSGAAPDSGGFQKQIGTTMSKRILSPSDEHGIAVYYVCGVSIRDIEAVFDVTRSTVHRVITRLGVASDRGKRLGKSRG